MSEEQLSALLAKLKEDVGLQEKLRGAADLDTALSLAKGAGFDVSKEDWLSHKAQESSELNDDDLESVVGGANKSTLSGSCTEKCTPEAATCSGKRC